MSEFIFDELSNDILLINSHKITRENVKSYVFKLAKYNYFIEKMDDNANYDAIVTYLKQYWSMFSGPDWHETIENAIKNCQKREYRLIDSIKITQKELDYIRSFNDIQLEKLLFVMLCIAKYDHFYSDSEDFWLNRSNSFIFGQARVHVKVKDRLELLRKLYLAGTFDMSHKVGSANKKILYVSNDNNDNVVLELAENDFKELAYTYLFYKNGFSGYVHCDRCGRLVKIKANNQKYCKNCADEIHLEKTAEYKRRKRRNGSIQTLV